MDECFLRHLDQLREHKVSRRAETHLGPRELEGHGRRDDQVADGIAPSTNL